MMPREHFQSIAIPREAPISDPQKPANGKLRFPKHALGILTVGATSIFFTVVPAEIFHTGQVITSAVSMYSAAADRATKEGLDLLAREIAEAVKEATVRVTIGRAEAGQQVESAKLEARKIRAKGGMAFVLEQTITPKVNYDVFEPRQQIFTGLLQALNELQPTLTNSKSLAVGLLYIDAKRSFVGRRVFPVTHVFENFEIDRICAFECIQYDWNSSECADEWERGHEGPEEVSDAEPISEWTLVLSEAQRLRLNIYRQVLRDFESLVFRKALDVERFKRVSSVLATNNSMWLNGELSRLYLELQKSRRQLHAVSEVEYLASTAQRSSVAAAHHGKDLVRLALGSKSQGDYGPASILKWVDEEVEKLTRATAQSAKREEALSFSLPYLKIRPLIANIWLLVQSGNVNPKQFFAGVTDYRADGFQLPHWFLLPPFVLVPLALLWRLYRRAKKVRLVLLAITLGVVGTVSVRSALQYNLFTADVGVSVANELISNVEAYPFVKRAAELRSQIEAAATKDSSKIVANGKVKATAITTGAEMRVESASIAPQCSGISQTERDSLGDRMYQWLTEQIHDFSSTNPAAVEDLKSTMMIVPRLLRIKRGESLTMPVPDPSHPETFQREKARRGQR